MTPNITLVSIGPVSPDLFPWLAGRLAEVIGQDIRIAEPVALPASAYDARRRQHRGHALIAALQALRSPSTTRLVGLADVDCYAPGLNFIFGQAAAEGREAIVALPRLRPSFYGSSEDPTLFRDRVVKKVVHELGHTWGLAHCAEPRWVMYFSNTVHDTDVKGVEFCPACRAWLAAEHA
ncbi:MAG: archaemetzincin family Zn-dependent metalloprotease [Candidatus Methylomirabilales bacterium]